MHNLSNFQSTGMLGLETIFIVRTNDGKFLKSDSEGYPWIHDNPLDAKRFKNRSDALEWLSFFQEYNDAHVLQLASVSYISTPVTLIRENQRKYEEELAKLQQKYDIDE